MVDRRVVALSVLALWSSACSERAAQKPAAPAASPVAAGQGAQALTVSIVEAEEREGWKDARSTDWDRVPPVALMLNRTPPGFSSDPEPAAEVPAAEARAVRAGQRLYLRLHWADAEENRSHAAEAKPYEAEPIYKRPTRNPSAFYDAAAVMMPSGQGWKVRFPSVVMGDAAEPVTLFYWRDGEPVSVLEGVGRGSIGPGRAAGRFEAAMAHDATGWTGVFALPAPADPETPFAFAIWDGAQAQRNGDKFFSPWYRPAKVAQR